MAASALRRGAVSSLWRGVWGFEAERNNTATQPGAAPDRPQCCRFPAFRVGSKLVVAGGRRVSLALAWCANCFFTRKPEKRQHCGRSGAAPCCVAVLFLSASKPRTPRQSDEAAPRRRADAANFDFTRPSIGGQSTACLAHPRGRSDTTLSSPAARQLRPSLSRAGEPENAETAGGRVQRLVVLLYYFFQPRNPKRRARATKPRPAGEPTPPTLTSPDQVSATRVLPASRIHAGAATQR